MSTQADLFRNEGLHRVRQNSGEWFLAAMKAVERLPSGEYTGEDVRLAIEPHVGNPHHHNAHGALIAQAVRRRILHPTGRWRKMRTAKSHARRTMIYLKVSP